MNERNEMGVLPFLSLSLFLHWSPNRYSSSSSSLKKKERKREERGGKKKRKKVTELGAGEV